ncbi:hypothetical protein [Pseudobacillus badius]|uniref:hypothetical protein n=1 Tax=Bacillus badius TaxID=1455 RepID=UPI0007B3DA93|nr:hypothetical protein [Bacillus badius]KZR57524.1 hypothetical protein A3781_19725 [Bacillus badius]
MRVQVPQFLQESIEKATSIFLRSENLERVNASADIYVERLPYLTDLLGSEGHISFTPVVERDLKVDFQQAVKADYNRVHDNYYFVEHNSVEERKKAYDCWYIVNNLYSIISNDDLLENKVPTSVLESIRHQDIKGLSSPKLSKLLVKLFGEQSDIVKWYTNKCPKQLDKGLNKDYKVHLSILPHHIAGMAYYAPYNWGGDKWITGWNYTSCMDTIRNSEGEGIYKLVPNLLDSTLAIAYLTTSHNDDLFEPRYQARLLVRVVKINDNDYVMVGLRPFYTSNTTRHILIEGLKNEFENFVHVDDLRKDYDMDKYTKFYTPIPTAWTSSVRESCDYCDGDGYDYDGDTCRRCDGEGYEVSGEYDHFPYVDDPDVLRFSDNKVIIKLPTEWLIEQEYIKKPAKNPLFSKTLLAC